MDSLGRLCHVCAVTAWPVIQKHYWILAARPTFMYHCWLAADATVRFMLLLLLMHARLADDWQLLPSMCELMLGCQPKLRLGCC